GRFWSYDGIEVLPKPLQQPHPPVWLAASSPDSIRRAATRGQDIFQDPHSTSAKLAAKRALSYQVLGEHGFSSQGRVIPTARFLAVAPTEREAEEVARRGAAWTVAAYANPAHIAIPTPFATPGDPVERYMDDVILYGTPERVTARIEELRETLGLD